MKVIRYLFWWLFNGPKLRKWWLKLHDDRWPIQPKWWPFLPVFLTGGFLYAKGLYFFGLLLMFLVLLVLFVKLLLWAKSEYDYWRESREQRKELEQSVLTVPADYEPYAISPDEG